MNQRERKEKRNVFIKDESKREAEVFFLLFALVLMLWYTAF